MKFSYFVYCFMFFLLLLIIFQFVENRQLRKGDLNLDNKVDLLDLSILSNNWSEK